MDDLARQLASSRRTLLALRDAIDDLVSEPEGDPTVRELARAVYRYDLHLDAPSLVDLIIVLVGLLATKLDRTPRQLWEQLWNEAPTDAWWQAHANRKEPGL